MNKPSGPLLDRTLSVVLIVLVPVALAVGLWYTTEGHGQWATLLILGVTALVGAWYAYQTQRLAAETGRMAASTEAMAKAGLHSVIELQRVTEEPFDGVTRYVPSVYHEIMNAGPGPALDVEIVGPSAGEEEGRVLSVGFMQAGQTIRVGELGLPVTLTYRDLLGNKHREVWSFDEESGSWYRPVADAEPRG